MRPKQERRFLYHAEAVGVAGTVTFPQQQTIEAQAVAGLPVTGGVSHSNISKFRHDELVSFDEARSETHGFYHPESDSYTTLVISTLEKLNIFNILTADRVVARITSTHPKDGGQPKISLVGSHFENLKIAGCRVEPDLAVDWFDDANTYSKVQEAYRTDGQIKWILDNDHPKHLLAENADKSPVGAQGTTSKTIGCTLVRNRENLSSEIPFENGGFYVPEVGTFHLGELFVNENERQLTMVRAELGCPTKSTIASCSVRGNGTTWPR
jgi:hypothetical protein